MLDSTGSPETFEEALLAHALVDNAVLDSVHGLQPADFADPVRRELFETMRDLRRDGRAVNIATLSALMGGDPLGGANPLDTLRSMQFGPNGPSPQDLADAIADASMRRAMMAQGEWLAGQVANLRTTPEAILATHMRELDALLARTTARRNTSFTFAEAMDEMLEELQSPDTTNRLSTGLVDLDNATGGIGRTELFILAGRPSMGKSAIAGNLAANTAATGVGVMIFSLEMGRQKWLARVASEAGWSNGRGIPYADALRKKLSGEQMEQFVSAAMKRRSLPSIIDDAGDLTVAEIAARTRRAAAHFERQGTNLGLVVVDHIGKVLPSKTYAGRRDLEVGEITHRLATLAKAENVAVLALHQLNRAVESRDNKRPQLSDLRDSGHVEQDADAVLLAYREAYYLAREKHDSGSGEELLRLKGLAEKQNILEIGIPKCRDGEVSTVELYCDMSCNVIRDLDRRHG